ncbi:SPP1 gp15-like head completion protein [Halorubrum tailed virus 28]|uniref:SPP1 gp15-like head completion protein n=1 Tax=Halorubrum tailed virus 28 TaxID=2878009 RepID=A0AAE9BYY7_9CAUD|nr:SPP1 gp15-like head completion protein [Halorubrum tailed virus 28]UBF23454.1 SPP1 gp15-like head completion protein [Halorubrum tailed virus 28]
MSAAPAPAYFGEVSSVIAQAGISPGDLEGVDTQAALESFIEDRLTGASNEVEEFCNRTFRQPVEYTETREGNQSDTLQLRHYPVTEVVAIDARGENIDASDVSIKQRRGFQGRNTGILKRDPGRRPRSNVWRSGRQYEITYMAGWESPPGVVGSVVEDMVIAGLREAIGSNAYAEEGASSISMDGFSVTYDVPGALRSGDITETQFKRLERLKQVAVA